MLEVYVDERAYEIADSPELTVGRVLDRVRAAARASDRLVVSVSCRGRELSADELAAIAGQHASGTGRLDLVTRPALQVARDIFVHSLALFEATTEPSQEAADLLVQGQTVRAMEILAGSFASWQTAHDSIVQAIGLAGLKIDELCRDGQTVEQAVVRFRDALRQIRQALQDRDFVLLGDLLQYELPETLNGWKGAILALQSATESPPA